MTRKMFIVFILLILFVGCFVYIYNSSLEGFINSKEKEKVTPEVATYELITSVMKPIRRLSSIILNPSEWKERVSMATMNPTQLARLYLQSQQKVEE